MHFCVELDIIVKVFRGVAQVVERYFREVEAASSSLVTPIQKYLIITGFRGYQDFLVLGEFIIVYHLLPDFIIQIRVQIGVQAESAVRMRNGVRKEDSFSKDRRNAHGRQEKKRGRKLGHKEDSRE